MINNRPKLFGRHSTLVHALCVLAIIIREVSLTPPAQAQVNRQAALAVTFELASDFYSGTQRQRENVLAVIDERGRLCDQEGFYVLHSFMPAPESNYRSLAPAQEAKAYAYVDALHKSYARYGAARAAGDSDWAAKQLKAAQEYAALLSSALTAEAQRDEQDVEWLRRFPFAVRRSPADQAAFLEKLKKSGLTPEHRDLMKESGRTQADIDAFQRQVLQMPADKVGASPVEMLSQIAAVRRSLAQQLDGFARSTPGDLAISSAQSFDVSNPHDKQETIDLFIRPISIPPDWKLSVSEADEQSAFKVSEIEAGKHYAVTLPAKGGVKVASVVVPVGEVGANTTARWAVEGKIGNELIGGMVHEMNVPYIIADLQLPPVGSKEVEEELPAPSKLWARIITEVAAGIVILALFVFFFLVWRRRRGGTAAS